jgi:hypothetical protein
MFAGIRGDFTCHKGTLGGQKPAECFAPIVTPQTLCLLLLLLLLLLLSAGQN